MFCNKCGHQFDDNFCPKCGAKAKNAPETPVNTTVNFSQEKDENPYDVYYNQQTENPQTERVSYTQPQQQTPQPHYCPPYYPPQTPKDKNLKWWQILLIVLTAIIGYGLISGVIPIACVGCAILTCEDGFINDYNSTTVSGIYHENETAVSNYLSYTITNVEYIDEYAGITPSREDYKFLKIEIKSVNISNNSEYISYDLSCYVGENLCNEIIPDNYYFSSGALMPGKNYTETRVFAIPKDADKINICLDDYYNIINFVIE